MGYYIGCDAHKRYSQFAVLDEQGQLYGQAKVVHTRGSLKEFLRTLPEPGKVALETIGNCYWIVDEIEAAGERAEQPDQRVARKVQGERQRDGVGAVGEHGSRGAGRR